MPSRILSMPLPRHSVSEITPGLIIDLKNADMRRNSVNRRSADFSIRSARSSKSSQESLITSNASLTYEIESPPLVCYGPANESSGALLSGQLWLNSHIWDLDMQSLQLSFQCIMTTKKPVMINCPDCASKTTDMHTWDLISSTHIISHGSHSFPFSYLIPGHTAATTVSALGSIRYRLHARGVSSTGEVVEANQDIKVSRAVLQGDDRQSLRIFPPTNLTANLTLPSVIHRGSDFPIAIRLDGVVTKSNNTRWRLRKIQWRMEEKSKIVSAACKVHAHKIGGEGKGVQYEDVKTIVSGEFKNGWKQDFTGDGKAEFEFTCGIPISARATDDIDNANLMNVSHNLVIEMIVSEEYVPKNTKMITPTGNARVLRMQFGMLTTARSGLGVSWDDECPPLYENVPSSPPLYQYDAELSEEFALL